MKPIIDRSVLNRLNVIAELGKVDIDLQKPYGNSKRFVRKLRECSDPASYVAKQSKAQAEVWERRKAGARHAHAE